MTINPEVRAAEIVAAVETDYVRGGWFAYMTRDEQRGWDLHEAEWWGCDCHMDRAPRNAREWAGWLARETLYPFHFDMVGFINSR